MFILAWSNISVLTTVPSCFNCNLILTNKLSLYGNPKGILQQPKIWAFKASSSFSVRPTLLRSLFWDCVILSVFLLVSENSSFDLSINAAMLFGSNSSFFSNSETCFTSSSSFSGFCFFSSIFLTFSMFSSGSGTESGFSFFTFFGGACSDVNFSSSFFLILSIIFFALGAKGILVLSVIWINSTDTIGGRSIGFLVKKGKLNAVINITTKWKPVSYTHQTLPTKRIV